MPIKMNNTDDKMNNTDDNKKVMLGFSDSGKYWEKLIPSAKESDNYSGKGYVSWGDDNNYSGYLNNLYNNVSKLKSLVDSSTDYVCGDGSECLVPGFEKEVNPKHETFEDILKNLVRDYFIYGGFAVQVVRNALGEIADLYNVDYSCVRVNKDKTVAYYSEEYAKKYARSNKTIRYPIWSDVAKDDVSIFYYSNSSVLNVYPTPVYGAAIRACEIQMKIDKFHLSAISNNFVPSYLISMNNGMPTVEQKEEIEKMISEKFANPDNAGNFLLSFANSKDNALTVSKIDTNDFSEKYKAASDRSRQELFSAFRCSPLLVGVVGDVNTGFSTSEFADSFKIYNRTMIKPVQKLVINAFNRLFGTDGSIMIRPFSLEDVDDNVITD